MLRMILASLLCLSIMHTSLSAQNEYHEKVIQLNLNAGIPLYADYVSLNFTDRTSEFSVGGLLNFDFSFVKRFSFGFGFAYQKFNRTLLGHRYTLNNVPMIEDVDLSINGFNISGRALWHFYNLYEQSNKKLDVYVGGGSGVIAYSYESDSPSPLIRDLGKEDYASAYGIVGFRYYPVEYFGVSMEAAFPTMYLVSIGVNYRFNWQALHL